MAYKVFANGFPLQASELNNFLMNQTVMVFASSAERASVLTAPTEGMVTYLQDTNALQSYNGTIWVAVGQDASVESGIITTAVNDKSANYSIVAADANEFIRSTSTAITITIDNVLSVGQSVQFIQDGTGQITFAAGAGVTLNSADGNLKTAKRYAGATVVCGASGVYYLIGNLGA
jgi:hypothetical protein